MISVGVADVVERRAACMYARPSGTLDSGVVVCFGQSSSIQRLRGEWGTFVFFSRPF